MEIITGVVVSFITKTGKAMVRSIGTHFGYLIHYDSNIRALEEQAKKLHEQQADLQRSIEAEERNGQVIATSVKSWLSNADGIIAELEKFLKEDTKANPRCLKGWCPNLKLRYSLSKKAKNKSEEVGDVLKEGKFQCISIPAPPPKMGSIFAHVKGFKSRIRIMTEILQSLEEDKINMIGICGMGGVGKTTMVKEVIKIVEREKMFKEVAMAIVSQTPDTRRIQGEIADQLGLTLAAESVWGRARKLHERLNHCESVLIILDDVWGELDLEEIGIPSWSNHKGCKIIVTSRNKDVLTKMKSQKDITVSTLSEREAWDLFVEMAGNSTKQSDLRPIAKEVAKECGGLPLAIVVVGKALGGKVKEVWLDAFDQLRKSSVSSFSEMNEFVFSRIKFSYNYLGNEEYKSCFLLCCLFPEDFNIRVEYLVRYGVGLNLFKGIDSLYEARNRVHAITEKLKSSSLLLEGDKNGFVKLHDVVRDAAISIVSEGERVFLVRCDDQLTKWPNVDTCKHCTAISLSCGNIEEYPDVVECPKLELLQLMNDGLIIEFPLPKGMEKLKVLTLEDMIICRDPSSFVSAKNIQSLCLHYCEMDNLSILGGLRSLEILSFVGCWIKTFSQELGQLRHLKLLDLTNVLCDEGIPPGILSNLSQLEELYLRYGFEGEDLSFHMDTYEKKWLMEWQTSMEEELKLLSHLKTLFIHIPNVKRLPKNFLLNNLMRFTISICINAVDKEPFYLRPNYLGIEANLRLIVESGIIQQLKKTEILHLKSMGNLKNGLHELEGQGFPSLKDLRLEECHDLEYVINAEDCTQQTAFPLLERLSLKNLHELMEIWHGQLLNEQEWLPCFGNMRYLEISWCHKLKDIIPLSIARGLVQLQCLKVRNCQNMEEIFSQEENQDGILFPNLTHMILWFLPNLINFCKVTDDASPKDPSLNHQVKSLDGQGSNSSCRMDKITKLQQDLHFGAGSSSSQAKLYLLPKLPTLLNSQWISRLPNLEELQVYVNQSLEVVFDLGRLSHYVEECKRIEMLAQLTKVDLQRLSKLTSIWMNVPKGFQGFGNLRILRVKGCPNLKQLFPPSIAKLLVKLEEVDIEACWILESILARDTEEGKEAYNLQWPSLKELLVKRCKKMNTFGSTIQSPTKVKGIKDARAGSMIDDSHLGRRSASQWSCTVCPFLCPKFKSNQSQKDVGSNFDEPTSKNEVTMSGLRDSNFTQTSNIDEIHSFFPASLIQGVQNLQTLELDSCASIKVIFDLSELDEEGNHDVLALGALKRLTLKNLSILMHIWKVGPKDIGGFQNLNQLYIDRCNSLRNFIPLSIAKFLVNLETMTIRQCDLLEEVVAQGVKEDKMDKITFPNLNAITLQILPNLTSFYSGACNIEFPFLRKMRVVGCVKLKTFVLSNVMTPKLQTVCMEHAYYPSMGDLNSTIRKIFNKQGNKFDQRTSESSGQIH